MSKRARAGDGGIKAAFALQAERTAAERTVADWPPLEAAPPRGALASVPDEYLQDVSQKAEDYLRRQRDVSRLVQQAELAGVSGSQQPASPFGACSSSQLFGDDQPLTPGGGNGGNGGASNHQHALSDQQRSRLLAWQSLAAFCVQQLGMWHGSGVALAAPQQELLLRIVANADLHLDPNISMRAYELLLQNLADHPPTTLLQPVAGAAWPPTLQCASLAGHCWDLGFTPTQQASGGGAGPPLLQGASTPFPLLQQLVRNAVALSVAPVEAAGTRGATPLGTPPRGGGGGGAGGSSSSPARALQGEALLLLYVLELLQADLLARHAAFEQHRRVASSPDAQPAARAEATKRAATALQHSLLFRVMQDDSIGGETWRFVPGQHRGKHQLVRDLLLLAASTGDSPAAAALQPPVGYASVQATIAAQASLHAGGGCSSAAATAPPVTASDLVGAGRRVLLLLLQLFSSCEEAGVYGSASGRHHMQRSIAGAAVQNDRVELDLVMMQAIGTTSGGVGATSNRLPQLLFHAAIARLLQALPPVHRARLLSLMVVQFITNRSVDPESEGKAAAASAANQQLAALKEYLTDKGRGHSGFRVPDALEILRAVDARLRWACEEMFGGGQVFLLMIALLVSGAAPQLLAQPDNNRKAFAEVGSHVLQHTAKAQRNNLAALVADGYTDAVLAVAGALQQLEALPAAA